MELPTFRSFISIIEIAAYVITIVITPVEKLIKEAKDLPFEGIGKPEPLKENLSGFWSCRIDDTHRLVYAVDDDYFTIISCRYHYQQ